MGPARPVGAIRLGTAFRFRLDRLGWLERNGTTLPRTDDRWQPDPRFRTRVEGHLDMARTICRANQAVWARTTQLERCSTCVSLIPMCVYCSWFTALSGLAA